LQAVIPATQCPAYQILKGRKCLFQPKQISLVLSLHSALVFLPALQVQPLKPQRLSQPPISQSRKSTPSKSKTLPSEALPKNQRPSAIVGCTGNAKVVQMQGPAWDIPIDDRPAQCWI